MNGLFQGIYKNKKVLVTGNTGFKGSWLTVWLLELGAEVYGISVDSDLQKLRPLSAKWILEPLIKDLIISLILGNWADVKQDPNLFVKIMRRAGLFRTIPVLLSLLLKLIKRFSERLLG